MTPPREMAPLLTPFSLFHESKKAELDAVGRSRLPIVEVVDCWRLLAEEDRKKWEEKATAVQEAYLHECTNKFLEDTKEVGGDDEDEGGDGEDEAEAEADGDDGDEEDPGDSSFHGPPRLPRSRVKRIAERATAEVGITAGRDATFALGKATELFLEKCTWMVLRNAARETRKTVLASHLTTALRLSTAPEAYQYFVEELQPAPPPEPAKVVKKKPSAKKAAAPKSRADTNTTAVPETAPEKAVPQKRKAPLPASVAEGIHPEKQCDKSGQCPIIGTRYNLVGQDFDLCEAEYVKLSPKEQAKYTPIRPTHFPMPPAKRGPGRPKKQRDDDDKPIEIAA